MGVSDRYYVIVVGAGSAGSSAAISAAGVELMLVAGRCFAATHDANASACSMATRMAMGQAADAAAAMAVAAGVAPRDLAADELRGRLRRDGALLEPLPSPTVGAVGA